MKLLFLLVGSALCQYPPMWDEAILLQDLPTDRSGAHVLDPWAYKQRMGSLKTLITVSTAASPCLYAGDIDNNVLWGLALQFGWQFDTGRLLTNTTHLTAAAWWGNMNFQLNVIPLLGALAAGYPGLPAMTVLPPPPGQSKAHFCLDSSGRDPACQPVRQALADWTLFFTTLPEAERQCTATNQTLPLDNLLAAMWTAHTSSLRDGLPLFEAELGLLSKEEAAFGTGWANLVEFIAAAHFSTALNSTLSQQVLLPARLLRAGDRAPFIKDLPKLSNRGVAMIEALAAANAASKGRILHAWLRAMCSVKGRIEGRVLINNMIRNPAVLLPGMVQLIADVATQPCD